MRLTTKKFSKTKSTFLQYTKINKVLSFSQSNFKRERTNKQENARGNIRSNMTEIQNHENTNNMLYANKYDNLKIIDELSVNIKSYKTES